MIKICKNCGAEFEPKTTWQEFHSDNCRVEYFRKAKAKQQQEQRPPPKDKITK